VDRLSRIIQVGGVQSLSVRQRWRKLCCSHSSHPYVHPLCLNGCSMAEVVGTCLDEARGRSRCCPWCHCRLRTAGEAGPCCLLALPLRSPAPRTLSSLWTCRRPRGRSWRRAGLRTASLATTSSRPCWPDDPQILDHEPNLDKKTL